jgi:putative endonuclease
MWRSDERRSKIGSLGEDIACRFLERKGHAIVERNFRKGTGEIDIVSKHDGTLHFVEVKSVSHETSTSVDKGDLWNPEDNIHPWKLKRIARTVDLYLLERRVSDETPWQLDAIAVFIEHGSKRARVRYTPGIVL